MRLILQILGGHYRLGNSHPKPATAVQGVSLAGFFRKFAKSTHSPTAILRIIWLKN
ncbi:hypothetical protein [Helicobacter canis]|uniref:hypothetical protein n=1 Tax=Helicobacter canis TaxID=29419 RepID=UPI0015F00E37|nr:hypothetical protein [Helicobacter canis]